MIKGFKGFNKDLKCRDFQYKIGEKYETNSAKCCESGFHFCEHPLNVFDFYSPSESRFCEVEGSGIIDKESSDTKVSSSKIEIGLELSLKSLTEAAVKFVFERADWDKKESKATGDRGASSATGDRGASSATGYQGASSATGYLGASSATGYQGASSATGTLGASSATGKFSAAIVTGIEGLASATGDHSIALAGGLNSKAKGALNCWIVLTERNDEDYSIIEVKAFRVDNVEIKENVYYSLIKGVATEIE